jgi:phosphoglycolate phosphatase
MPSFAKASEGSKFFYFLIYSKRETKRGVIMETKFGIIKLVIFDWSGVISNDMRAVFRCNQLIVESHGVLCTIAFEDYFRQGKTFDEFLRENGIIIDDYAERAELFRINFQLACETGDAPTIIPGIIPFLVSVRDRNIPMIIVSAHLQEFIERESQGYNIRSFFKEVNAGTTEGKASVIKDACERFGLKPEEVLFFGDTIFDIQSGQEVGVWTVALSTGYHSEEMLRTSNPDVLASSLVDAFNKLEVK